MLQCEALIGTARHAFTTRPDAPPPGGLTDEGAPGIAKLAAFLGLGPSALAQARQVHGREVIVAPDPMLPDAAADIMVTSCADCAVVIRAADCVPLLVAHSSGEAVAAAHAGWQGTMAGVAGRTVDALSAHAGVARDELVALIGPSIGPCCYEVGPEIRSRFEATGWEPHLIDRWFGADAAGRLRLDLWQATIDQLTRAGLAPRAIHCAAMCTATHRAILPSFRVEGPAAGRLFGAIRPAGRP